MAVSGGWSISGGCMFARGDCWQTAVVSMWSEEGKTALLFSVGGMA